MDPWNHLIDSVFSWPVFVLIVLAMLVHVLIRIHQTETEAEAGKKL